MTTLSDLGSGGDAFHRQIEIVNRVGGIARRIFNRAAGHAGCGSERDDVRGFARIVCIAVFELARHGNTPGFDVLL